MIFGDYTLGAAATLTPDTLYLTRVDIPFAQRLAKISAYLEPTTGDGRVRPVVYTTAGALVAQGDEIVVEQATPAAWRDMPLAGAADVGGAGQSYLIGYHVAAALRGYFGSTGPLMRATVSAPYTAGPPLLLTGRTNLATNPRGGVDATGWVTQGGPGDTMQRVATLPTTDGLPAGVTTGFRGTLANTNVRFHHDRTLEAGKTYTWSVYVRKDTGGGDVSVKVAREGFPDITSSPVHTVLGGAFVRLSVTYTAVVTGVHNIYVHGNAAGDIHFTAAQLEERSAATSWFDGASEGGAWTGTAHNSTSTGPPDASTPGGATLFLTTFSAWKPREATDEEYARLGFASTQQVLAGSTVRGTTQSATAAWHGTKLDPERGAFAVVREDGPLADYVGERVRVRHRNSDRSVIVYCHRQYDLVQDISLSRRAFAELDELTLEELNVIVEVIE